MFKPVQVDVDEAVKLYESGLTLMEVGEALGVSWMTVRRRLKDRGVELRHVGRKSREQMSHMDIDIIERDYLAGATTYELGDKYGIHHATISKWMVGHGHRRGKGHVAPMRRACPRCGKEFVSDVRNQTYCSKSCQRAACSGRRRDLERVGSSEHADAIMLREVWRRDRGVCYLCGRKTDWNDYRVVRGWRVTGPRYPTRDHVIALNNGGSHTWDNVRLACFECNSAKADKGQMRLAI